MTRFQRLFLWWSTGLTFVSGLGYFWVHRFVEPADPWAVVNHPLEPWLLKAHILAAPAMLFAVGLITSNHIARHWRSGLPTARRTGLLAGWTFGPLVVSGYLIQAVTHPTAGAVLGWVHVGLGVACVLGVVAHRRVLKGRRPVRARGRLPVVRLPETAPAASDGQG